MLNYRHRYTYFNYKRVAISPFLHNISLTVATLSIEIINPKNINIMKVITNRIVAQGKHFTSDKVETPIGWLKYASDTDEALDNMVQQIYNEIGNDLLNINIIPFTGLLEGRLFVPVSYTIVYTYKLEDNDANT